MARDHYQLMDTFISHSATETAAFGEEWGCKASHGSVIGLYGELGAGKTQFVKGFARGMGIVARVHSPTFALINIYQGPRLNLFHLDLYRLQTPDQIRTAGLQEYLQPDGVTVIEWAERWFGEIEELRAKAQPKRADEKDRPERTEQPPANFRWVLIESMSENERRITYDNTRA